MSLCLDIGCGEFGPRPDYLGVDLRALPGVTMVCAAWEILAHAPVGTVDAIYSRHMLEHLTFAQARETLSVWRQALRAGGLLEVIVPDLAYHAAQVLQPDVPSAWYPGVTNLAHALGSLFGWQRHAHDTHQSGWTATLLTEALSAAGFVAIARQPEAPWNLFLRAKAPGGV